MSRDLRSDELPGGDPADGDRGGRGRGPELRPTGWPTMLVALVVGALIGLAVVVAFEAAGALLPVTPWTMSTMVAVLGVVAAIFGRTLRARLEQGRAQVSNESGVLAFVAGRTLLVVGLLLAGGHLAYALMQLGDLARPLPRERLVWGLVAVACAALMAVGGGILERAAWLGGKGGDDPASDPD